LAACSAVWCLCRTWPRSRSRGVSAENHVRGGLAAGGHRIRLRRLLRPLPVRPPPPPHLNPGESTRRSTAERRGDPRPALPVRYGTCAVGATFLASAGGDGGGRGFYYEVEVLKAPRSGDLFVGFAGTNFGPQCRNVGDDACSWGCQSQGYSVHRSSALTNSEESATEARINRPTACDSDGFGAA
jgi:hypothetical protein